MLVYCDSVVLIYFLEGAPHFQARAAARLATLWAAGDVVGISDLVRLECRMQPIRLADNLRLAKPSDPKFNRRQATQCSSRVCSFNAPTPASVLRGEAPVQV